MSKPYTVERSLLAQGGSVTVALPPIWLEHKGLAKGDRVLVKLDFELDQLIIEPAKPTAEDS